MNLNVFGTNPGRVRDLVGTFGRVQVISPPQSLDDYLVLENLQCFDAEGRITESYPQVFVRKSVEKEGGKILVRTPSDCVAYCSEHGLILPSFALTFAIVQRLFESKSDPACLEVLMQYKNKGDGNGWHTTNTIVNWKNRRIIHYPRELGHSTLSQVEHSFEVKDFGNFKLSQALKNNQFRNYLINLTGLRTPESLLELGNLFKKSVMAWVPNNPKEANYTSGAWFGCNVNYLYLDCFDVLTDNDGFRGVRFGAAGDTKI